MVGYASLLISKLCVLIITITIAVTSYHHHLFHSTQPPPSPSHIYHPHRNLNTHTILHNKLAQMANLYVQAVPPTDLNRNTEWFMYPGVWTTYILILFFAWLVVLSVTGCSPGMAWTTVNLCHALVFICCCLSLGLGEKWRIGEERYRVRLCCKLLRFIFRFRFVIRQL
ncbi:putative ORMDL family protein [Helianthus annuus]|uniref:ORMDL family protein n=1 Tax=Helianthus annuus TaxID=4232 RepID=A0A9K3P0F8_HELAN|nr:putative ORMDL family protein [Helianthus annuus]KAJ0952101.1 putative ORMDL family protein [Helianthus annuus]